MSNACEADALVKLSVKRSNRGRIVTHALSITAVHMDVSMFKYPDQKCTHPCMSGNFEEIELQVMLHS